MSLIENSLRTGAIASAATTLAASICGKIEEDNGVAPLNAVSHILWGDSAAKVDEPTLAHTVPGISLNTAAVTGWAAVQEMLLPKSNRRLDTAIFSGVVVSGLAYLVDYYVVPKRFTPGFEKRLSNRSLFGIYATLAASLAVGSMLGKR